LPAVTRTLLPANGVIEMSPAAVVVIASAPALVRAVSYGGCGLQSGEFTRALSGNTDSGEVTGGRGRDTDTVLLIPVAVTLKLPEAARMFLAELR